MIWSEWNSRRMALELDRYTLEWCCPHRLAMAGEECTGPSLITNLSYPQSGWYSNSRASRRILKVWNRIWKEKNMNKWSLCKILVHKFSIIFILLLTYRNGSCCYGRRTMKIHRIFIAYFIPRREYGQFLVVFDFNLMLLSKTHFQIYGCIFFIGLRITGGWFEAFCGECRWRH